MKSFIKVNVGNKVFDNTQQVEGVVKYINYETNIVQVVIDPLQEEIVLCKLANLTVLGNDKPTQPEYDFDKWSEQVKEFHVAFGHPVADKPTPITLERMTSRKIWEFEEGVEAIHASSSNVDEFNEAVDKVLQGIEKAREKSLKEDFPKNDVERIVAQGDAITDGTYFLQGDMVELGLKPDPLFDIVQKANMSKLFTSPDGTKYAKYRESDGKILKSPEFFSPEPLLEEEVLRQMNENK